MLHEPVGGEHDAAAGVHVVLAGDALDAAEMVDVAVAVDDAEDGPIAAMLPVERERGRGGFGRDRGSMTITPVLPSTKVMFERSKPRTW